MNDLHHLLSDLDKKPDIIALSETKLTNKINTHYHPHLDNYTFFGTRSKSYFGGVGVFIRNTLTCNVRNDLNCSEYGLFEMLWFDSLCIRRNAQKTTIGIVYRHQGSPNIPSFTSRMENILNKLNHERANFYIFGDYNINLIKTDDVHNISEFVNSMYSHSAVNLVNKPTRFPIGAQI